MPRCPNKTVKVCTCVPRPPLPLAKRKRTKVKPVDKSKIGKGVKKKAMTKRVTTQKATKSTVKRRPAPMVAKSSIVRPSSAKLTSAPRVPLRKRAPIPKMPDVVRTKYMSNLIKKINLAMKRGDMDEVMRLQLLLKRKR